MTQFTVHVNGERRWVSQDELRKQQRTLVELEESAGRSHLRDKVRLGSSLLEVRAQLKHGDWYPWVDSIGLHRKKAPYFMRLAEKFADSMGDLNSFRLFECLHAFDSVKYPSLEAFDHLRVSQREADKAQLAQKHPAAQAATTAGISPQVTRALPLEDSVGEYEPPFADEPDYFLDHEPTEEELATPRPRVDRFMDDDDEPVGGRPQLQPAGPQLTGEQSGGGLLSEPVHGAGAHAQPGRSDSTTASFQRVDDDPIYAEAVAVATREGRVSVAMLQRLLGIGYTRAANLIETMVVAGVAERTQGTPPFHVLASTPSPPVPPAAQAIAAVPARPSLLTRGVRTAEQQLTLDSLYVEARTALRDLADKIEARILSDDDVRRVVEFLKSLPVGDHAASS